MFKTFAAVASLISITAAAAVPAASVYSTINTTAETVREIVLADLNDQKEEENKSSLVIVEPDEEEQASSQNPSETDTDTGTDTDIDVSSPAADEASVPEAASSTTTTATTSTTTTTAASENAEAASSSAAYEPAAQSTVSDSSNSSNVSSAAKNHSVDASFISSEMSGKYSYDFLQILRSGSRILYYDGDSANAEDSLSEVISFYCSLKGGIDYYEIHDETGYYLEIADSSWSKVKEAVAAADAGWAAYQDAVANACNSLNLYTSDEDLVNQINNYICANFDYEVTNSGMPVFISTGRGQCWHYAKMFADMCNAVGISAWKVENTEHAWDNVVVDGVTYKFDPTYNDTSGNWTAYSWLAA